MKYANSKCDRIRKSEIGLVEQVLGVTLVVDLVLQYGLGPAETSGGAQVELAFERVFDATEDNKVFCPTDFSNQWLVFWQLAVTAIEVTHVPQVTCRKAIAAGECGLQVACQGLALKGRGIVAVSFFSSLSSAFHNGAHNRTHILTWAHISLERPADKLLPNLGPSF
jgi:hypothetical protein